MARKVAGMDPGKSGAISIYGGPDVDGGKASVFAIPVNAHIESGRERIDFAGLWTLCEIILADPEISEVFIEDVGVMPKQGSVSGFNFGYGAGALRLCAIAMGKRVVMVRPAMWKKSLELTSDKATCRARAITLGLVDAETVIRSGDDGLAEAALLAYYGYVNEPGAVEDMDVNQHGGAIRKRVPKTRRVKNDVAKDGDKLRKSSSPVSGSRRTKADGANRPGPKDKRARKARR